MLSPVSTGIGYHLRTGISPQCVTKPTRSTQLCIPLGSLNRIFTLAGWDNGGNISSVGWQVTLCDLTQHVSSRSSEACCNMLYQVTLLYLLILLCAYDPVPCIPSDQDQDLDI